MGSDTGRRSKMNSGTVEPGLPQRNRVAVSLAQLVDWVEVSTSDTSTGLPTGRYPWGFRKMQLLAPLTHPQADQKMSAPRP